MPLYIMGDKEVIGVGYDDSIVAYCRNFALNQVRCPACYLFERLLRSSRTYYRVDVDMVELLRQKLRRGFGVGIVAAVGNIGGSFFCKLTIEMCFE